jgi:hypothetical protein
LFILISYDKSIEEARETSKKNFKCSISMRKDFFDFLCGKHVGL